MNNLTNILLNLSLTVLLWGDDAKEVRLVGSKDIRI